LGVGFGLKEVALGRRGLLVNVAVLVVMLLLVLLLPRNYLRKRSRKKA